MAKSGYKGVCRIDHAQKNSFGWYVRVDFNGTRRSKFFNDQKYGGREKGLEAAVEFRDQAERELGKPRTERLVIARNPRNRSGITGVQRKTKVVKKDGGERVIDNVYEVTWSPEPGRVRRAWVSIDEYGEEAALRKACAIRREKEREMYGSVVETNWADSLSKLCSF